MSNDIGSSLARSVVYVRQTDLNNNFSKTFSLFQLESKSYRTEQCWPYIGYHAVLPLVGGQGGLQPTRNFGVQLTLLQPGGQIMPTTLLLAHPDLKTQRHLCHVKIWKNFMHKNLHIEPFNYALKNVFFCFFFHSTNMDSSVIGTGRHEGSLLPYFYWFRCHYSLNTYLY